MSVSNHGSFFRSSCSLSSSFDLLDSSSCIRDSNSRQHPRAIPRTRSRRIPPIGVFVPIRRATLRVARSSAVVFGQSVRPHVRRPLQQPAAATLSESDPAGSTATAKVPVAAELPAGGRRLLHLFHFASVVLHFECSIDRQSTPTPASCTLAERSHPDGELSHPIVGRDREKSRERTTGRSCLNSWHRSHAEAWERWFASRCSRPYFCAIGLAGFGSDIHSSTGAAT